MSAPIPTELDQEFREWMWNTRGHWIDVAGEFMSLHGLDAVRQLPAVYDQYREFIDSRNRIESSATIIVDEE